MALWSGDGWDESNTLVALQWLVDKGATSGVETQVMVEGFLSFMVLRGWFRTKKGCSKYYQKLLKSDYVRSGRQRGKGRKPGKWYVWVGNGGRKFLKAPR